MGQKQSQEVSSQTVIDNSPRGDRKVDFAPTRTVQTQMDRAELGLDNNATFDEFDSHDTKMMEGFGNVMKPKTIDNSVDKRDMKAIQHSTQFQATMINGELQMEPKTKYPENMVDVQALFKDTINQERSSQSNEIPKLPSYEKPNNKPNSFVFTVPNFQKSKHVPANRKIISPTFKKPPNSPFKPTSSPASTSTPMLTNVFANQTIKESIEILKSLNLSPEDEAALALPFQEFLNQMEKRYADFNIPLTDQEFQSHLDKNRNQILEHGTISKHEFDLQIQKLHERLQTEFDNNIKGQQAYKHIKQKLGLKDVISSVPSVVNQESSNVGQTFVKSSSDNMTTAPSQNAHVFAKNVPPPKHDSSVSEKHTSPLGKNVTTPHQNVSVFGKTYPPPNNLQNAPILGKNVQSTQTVPISKTNGIQPLKPVPTFGVNAATSNKNLPVFTKAIPLANKSSLSSDATQTPKFDTVGNAAKPDHDVKDQVPMSGWLKGKTRSPKRSFLMKTYTPKIIVKTKPVEVNPELKGKPVLSTMSKFSMATKDFLFRTPKVNVVPSPEGPIPVIPADSVSEAKENMPTKPVTPVTKDDVIVNKRRSKKKRANAGTSVSINSPLVPVRIPPNASAALRKSVKELNGKSVWTLYSPTYPKSRPSGDCMVCEYTYYYSKKRPKTRRRSKTVGGTDDKGVKRASVKA
ncbi:hypothetical protein BC833DRAFT_215669 [Globomyces pollinis-pini]|nr:hypothetical protein BC833DRAFT_215669 [Globomyces pollinis-pini]